MLRVVTSVVCVVLFTSSAAHAEKPPQLETKIESVGLFKNGLAVVRRSITLPANQGDTFDITDLPEPVHGTFWVESTATLEISVTTPRNKNIWPMVVINHPVGAKFAGPPK